MYSRTTILEQLFLNLLRPIGGERGGEGGEKERRIRKRGGGGGEAVRTHGSEYPKTWSQNALSEDVYLLII